MPALAVLGAPWQLWLAWYFYTLHGVITNDLQFLVENEVGSAD